ncbi:MAG: N-acetylmuramoyl-L-alanine amidase [Gammaproteobacteria bacterium]|nr:N-acetylmuramoyl-L-alanine amidase [Gammaproteobacteria bacterium]MBU2685897.1 N-acetylmuramoyl-L-alanine amidase [Gammaproteobacteria bacterium]
MARCLSGRLKRQGKATGVSPWWVTIHYTAGPSLISAVNTFLDPKTRVSAHLIVDRNGKVVQCVPFDVIAWHAGKSEWKGRTGLNAYSIGIEMVNAGRLDEVENIEELRSWWGGLYPRSEALFALDRQKTYWSWWHSYTDVQIKAVEDLCQTLMKSYPICYILGHDEIAPGRKSDPGPTFPLDELKQFLRK